ncbi:HlyC/CorC family transporter [Candidatus Poribacteria bacterium]|nr:HlyC/CorC family transporter [Candidatus Poribacteria bacterium]
MYIEILILIVLIILSALFSAAETALTSISKLRIKHLIHERGDKASDLNIWLQDPIRILTICLILNNVVNIAASSITTVISITYFSNNNLQYRLSIGMGILTLILLVYGEIVPKNLGRKYSEELAIFFIKPLDVIASLLSPIVIILGNMSAYTIKLLRLPPRVTQELVTEQEIKMLIDIGHKEGVVEKSEREMLHRIFRFYDTKVNAVMVPAERMICGQINMNINDLLDLIIIKGHSRIPIYDAAHENIIGIIYERDVLLCIKENSLINISDILREPFRVNEEVMIDELLHDFQQKLIQMAIVMNNKGKTVGLVTVEDLIEEIVGEIDEKLVRKNISLRKKL